MKKPRCEWCGQDDTAEYPVWGHKEDGVNYFVSHQTRGYCIMAALARAERAEAEAAALRAQLDAARAGQVQARCCYCNKPATMARTYYDRGFPSAREHLCAEHFEHHPWHGDEEARP